MQAMRRREFLKEGILAAAGGAAATVALGPGAAPAMAAEAESPPASRLPARPFGKTGFTLPILGLGGSAMVLSFISGYGARLLPPDERVAMVRHAFDRGIRYFDTARIYGESESIFGKGLKGVRDQVYLATKVHTTKPGAVRQSVETSLRELGVDRVECVQLHSPAIEALGFEGAMKIHAELVKLRDAGLFKFIGLTTHVAFETVHRMIATGGFDQVLLAHGYFKKGMDTMLSHRNLESRELCLAKAHELGMAVVAMKVLGANILSHNAGKLVPDYDPAKLEKLPGAAIRYVLADGRVTLLNIGASYPEDIDKNVAVLTGDLRFTTADQLLLADFAARAYESEAVKKMRVT
jgi:aryl-alcohol dehydrogenase-like predicted oxidoreductase